MRKFTAEGEEFERTLFRTTAEFVQVVTPQSLGDRPLGLKHYANISGQPGGRPFELVLARAPRRLALQAQPKMEEFSSSRAYYLKWQLWVKRLMRSTDKSLGKKQVRYKCNFDARLRKPKYDIPVGFYLFFRKEQGTATEPKHKLAQVASNPYQVRGTNQGTVVIAIGDEEERVSRDSVELAPSPMEHVPITSLRQPLQSPRGTKGPGKGNIFDDEDDPPYARSRR